MSTLLAFDYRNRQYDPAVPVFVVINEDWVFDRLARQHIRRESLPADLAPPELDAAPQWWLYANLFAGEDKAERGAPITGTASAIATDRNTITFGGGPADAVYTATVTIDTGDGNLDQVFALTVNFKDSAVDVAADLGGQTLQGGTLTVTGRDVLVIATGGTLVKSQVAVT